MAGVKISDAVVVNSATIAALSQLVMSAGKVTPTAETVPVSRQYGAIISSTVSGGFVSINNPPDFTASVFPFLSVDLKYTAAGVFEYGHTNGVV
jgi:hypothetical protein